MRGNRQQEPAARYKQLPKRNKRLLFFLYMLENVKHADEIKLFAERTATDVPLDEETTSGSPLGMSQPFEPEFQSNYHTVWTSFAEHPKYISGPTANLQHKVSGL